MFERSQKPRLFGIPPGVDFPAALLEGLRRRMEGKPPEAFAKIEIYVNTRAMRKRLGELFTQGPTALLPRIHVVTDLSQDTRFPDIPPPEPPLRRRLELMQLVGRLLDRQPDLAPRSARFALADSLAGLMDEMQSEGVPPERIRDLDVTDVSGHWQRGLEFVSLVERYFGQDTSHGLDALARQRLVAERLGRDWSNTPPSHPILVAGSTGSRGATSYFMQLVARLPQGAVILPGVDFDLPRHVWARLGDAMAAQDHPQYRFARLCDDLRFSPDDIRLWEPSRRPSSPDRNRLVSLALRPAPVTDQWRSEGAKLNGIANATKTITLIEAPSPQAEASTLAVLLRGAFETGKTAALVTPDQMLARRVTAALDRWAIKPDDAFGQPLALTASGRLLRQVAALFGQTLSAGTLLALLKHPLTGSGAKSREGHLQYTQRLELRLRRFGPSFPGTDDLLQWAERHELGSPPREWGEWIAGLFDGLSGIGERSLPEHVDHHIHIARSLAAGPGMEGSGRLWLGYENKEVKKAVDELRCEAEHGGILSPGDYASLFDSILWRGSVHEIKDTHGQVMIWGLQQSRVQGVDMVILAGMNEGNWPVAPQPDPWLNRQLRQRAGLLLPERRIGLAAHDVQQAITASEVVLSRAIRDSESQTVPSRWLNRLVNLLEGLPGEGAEALDSMRERGNRWLEIALRLDRPESKIPGAKRPAPRPPVENRPTEITITEVERLIRDPYSVYARRILGLRALDPLHHVPDAPMRGTVIHRIVERFADDGPIVDLAAGRVRLLRIADEILADEVAWPATRRLWRAKLAGIADWFIAGEIERRAGARPVALERAGAFPLPNTGVTLNGKIDRVDRRDDGTLVVYDYKTGAPPSAKQQTHFNKQLPLSAVLIENGAVKDLEAATVAEVAYIGLGANPRLVSRNLESDETQKTLDELEILLESYQSPKQGYLSRRAMATVNYGGDFDHLARFGEWSDSDCPDHQEVR